MKFVIKIFCALLVAGVGGLFILKKPDGTPWLNIKELIPDFSISPIKKTVTNVMPEQILGGGDSNKVSVYKWKDAEGNWQFSDKPPENTSAEQVLIDTHVNRDLVPELKTSTQTQASTSGKAILIKDSSLPTPTTVSPDNITKLIEDAKNVQGLVDERQKQLEQATQ